MSNLGKRPWILPLAAAVLTIAIAVTVIVVQLTGGESGERSKAAALPTACENFERASALFARGGSSQSLEMTGGHVFTRDTQADSKQILQDLMAACDRERSAR